MIKYSMVMLAFVKVTTYSGWTLCLEPFIEISGFLLEFGDIIFCDLDERGREGERREREIDCDGELMYHLSHSLE